MKKRRHFDISKSALRKTKQGEQQTKGTQKENEYKESQEGEKGQEK